MSEYMTIGGGSKEFKTPETTVENSTAASSVETQKTAEQFQKELQLDHQGLSKELSEAEKEKQAALDAVGVDLKLEQVRMSEGATLTYLKDSPLVLALGGPEKSEVITMFSRLDHMFSRLIDSYVAGSEHLDKKDLMSTEQFFLLQNAFVVSMIQGIAQESESDQSGGVLGKLTGWIGGSFGMGNVEKAEDISLTKIAASFLGKMNKMPAKHVCTRLEDLVSGMDALSKTGQKPSLTMNSGDLLNWLSGAMPKKDLESKILLQSENIESENTGSDQALKTLASSLLLDEDGQALLKDLSDIDKINTLLGKNEMQKQSRSMYGTFENMLSPFKWLLGKDSTKDILESRGLSGVANVFLGWIGYEGGLDALHNNYLLDQIDTQLSDEQKNAIAHAFSWVEVNLANRDAYPLDTSFENQLKQAGVTDKHPLFPHVPLSAKFLTDALTSSFQSSKAVPSVGIVEKFCPQCVSVQKNADGTVQKNIDATMFLSDANMATFVKSVGTKSFVEFVKNSDSVKEGSIQNPQTLVALWIAETFMAPGTARAFGDGVVSIGEGQYFDTATAAAKLAGVSMSSSTDAGSTDVLTQDAGSHNNVVDHYGEFDYADYKVLPDPKMKNGQPRYDEAFARKVVDVCKELKIPDPNMLMQLMDFETGYSLSPQQKGYAKESTGVGLIQFVGAGQKWVGKTREELLAMNGVEQLDMVKLYFKKWDPEGHGFPTLASLYLTILYPAARFFADKPDQVVYAKSDAALRAYDPANYEVNKKRASIIYPAAYAQNGFDKVGIGNKDGVVTVAEVMETVQQRVGNLKYFESIGSSTSTDALKNVTQSDILLPKDIELGKKIESAPGTNTVVRAPGFVTSGYFWPKEKRFGKKVAIERMARTKQVGDRYLQTLKDQKDPVITQFLALPEAQDEAIKYGFLGMYYSYKELGTRYFVAFDDAEIDQKVMPLFKKIGLNDVEYKFFHANNEYDGALKNMKEICRMFYDAKVNKKGLHTHCTNGRHRANIHMYAAKMIVENKSLEQVAKEFQGLDRDWMKKEEIAHGKDGGGYGKFHELLVKISENRAEIAKDFGYVDTKLDAPSNKELSIANSSSLLAKSTQEVLPFGDSWSMGVARTISQVEDVRYMVGGEQSEDILKRLETHISSMPSGVKSVWILNTMNDRMETKEQAESKAKVVKKMIDVCIAHDKQPIISLLPQPKWSPNATQYGMNDNLPYYQKIVVDYANSKNIGGASVPVFDIRDTDMGGVNGYHPSSYQQLVSKFQKQFGLGSTV